MLQHLRVAPRREHSFLDFIAICVFNPRLVSDGSQISNKTECVFRVVRTYLRGSARTFRLHNQTHRSHLTLRVLCLRSVAVWCATARLIWTDSRRCHGIQAAGHNLTILADLAAREHPLSCSLSTRSRAANSRLCGSNEKPFGGRPWSTRSSW
jgi:hypothetical protein